MDTLSVLLVDDDEDDLLLVREALADAPGEYEVESVTSVAAALERAEAGAHDVYLVDYRLGADSGVDFIRRACGGGHKGTFILLTGQGREGTDTEALRAGAADYLAKCHLTPDSLDRSIRYAVERHASQGRIREAQRFQTIGVLAAGMAHEYNNLLTAIIGSVDLARWSLDKDTVASLRHLSTIETAAKEAAAMTLRLLTYAGGAPLDLRPLLLQDVLDGGVALARDLVGSAFAVAAPDDASELVLEGDLALLTQAIGGVLANAHEAAPGVAPVISAEIRELDAVEMNICGDASHADLRSALVLTISNGGEELSAEVLDRAFEPFYSTKFLGRGLGLAAADGTVRRHGGAIRLRGRPGGGAVTTIMLPAHDRRSAGRTS